MKILATKSIGVGYLYSISLILSIIIMACGFYIVYFFLVGIVMALIALGIMIDYFKTAKTPIMLSDKNELVLPKGIILELSDVKDVSYRRASSGRGIQYKWGTVKITSTKGEFKFRYLENCEEVAKTILKLVYQSKE